MAKLLSDYQSQLSIPALPRIPLLLDDPEYLEAQAQTKKAGELAATRNAVASVIERLKGPVGTDPVSVANQLLLTGVLLEETGDHFQAACTAIKTRYPQKRAPGFADAGKPDGGIGDLLIWQSLLRLAADRKCHCVFVSSDRKADWWVQANGAFQPKLELLEEYRAASEGRTLHLALLGDVLELVGASSDTVEEVRSIEVPEDQERLYTLLKKARKLQAEGRSRKTPEHYRARAFELEKKIADGLASRADVDAADQFMSLAAHLENKARIAGYELAKFEKELAAEGLELMREQGTDDVYGIRTINGEL